MIGYQEEQMNDQYSVDLVDCLLHQEASGCLITDYMDSLPQHYGRGPPVDAEAREAIASWCFKIMEACRYSSDTAVIAMSYLDRYMSSPSGRSALLDREEFKLVSLACVYTAIKINEKNALASHLIAKLSNGERTGGEIERMELRLLQGLDWRMHLPTAMDFVRASVCRIPEGILDAKSKETVLSLAQYQLDASVLEYKLCMERPSHLAIAALLNAAETVSDDDMILCYFQCLSTENLCVDTRFIAALRERLYETLYRGTNLSPASPSKPSIRKPPSSNSYFSSIRSSSFSSSPRTVQFP